MIQQIAQLIWYPPKGFHEWRTNQYDKQGWRLCFVYNDKEKQSWLTYQHPITSKLQVYSGRNNYVHLYKITPENTLWHNIISNYNRITLNIMVTDEFIKRFIEFI